MRSRITILLEALSCKDKTCPVCKKGTVSMHGTPGFVEYSCSNPKCIVKNCNELWFLCLALDCWPVQALEFAMNHKDSTELGTEAHSNGKIALAMSEISLFGSEFESGRVGKPEEAGFPVLGLGKNVVGMIGAINRNMLPGNRIRFFYSDGKRITATGVDDQIKPIFGFEGCFPLKTHENESTIYVFPTPKDVLNARYTWKSAGLGNFPAYAFAGFPLPAGFSGTKRIIFVNVGGKIAKPDILGRALATYGSGVSISPETTLDLDGLRAVFVEEPESSLPQKPKLPKMDVVGKTKNGLDIFFSKNGYYVQEDVCMLPKKKTNFAFFPKKIYISPVPSRKIMVSDLYIDGSLEASDIPMRVVDSNRIRKFRDIAQMLAPDKFPAIYGDDTFSGSKFVPDNAQRCSFPFMPCACSGDRIVFPEFVLSKKGVEPHPALRKTMSEIEKNLDYTAVPPELGGKSDMLEFERLILDGTSESEATVLCICAWLYMAVTCIVEIHNEITLPKLCFELHSAGNSVLAPISFMCKMFSGDIMPRNHAMYTRDTTISRKSVNAKNPEYSYSRLPGLFDVDLSEKTRNADMLYKKTGIPGLYLVRNSDLKYPVNAHGNIYGTITCGNGEMPKFNQDAICRAILYILKKYLQNIELVDPETWIVEKPELFMYNSMANALGKLGIILPGEQRFYKLYLNKGR